MIKQVWFSMVEKNKRILHRDYSVEIVLVRSCRNQQVTELDPVFEHYREYLRQSFVRYFPLLYEATFAEKWGEDDFLKLSWSILIQHTSIPIRVCRWTSSSFVTPRNVNIIGRPPQRTGRVTNCQRSVKIPGSVDLNTNESFRVSLGKMES
jgi:hypothetical protein